MVEASRDEASLAVRLYNNATDIRSFEGFVVHMHLAWHQSGSRPGTSTQAFNPSSTLPAARCLRQIATTAWTLDGVEQLSRYLDLTRRDTLLGTVHGILAAQLIKPQARVLARDRGINCVIVDYDLLRGLENTDDRLF